MLTRIKTKRAQLRLRPFAFFSQFKLVHGVNDKISTAYKQDRDTNPQQNERHNDLHELPDLNYRAPNNRRPSAQFPNSPRVVDALHTSIGDGVCWTAHSQRKIVQL